jgi:hypothetical protein
VCVRKLGKNVFIEHEKIKSDMCNFYTKNPVPLGPILDFVFYTDLDRARGFKKKQNK